MPTTSAVTAVGNIIPGVSNSGKKTDYNTEINEIEKKITYHNHDKYIATPEFNKFTAQIFHFRCNKCSK